MTILTASTLGAPDADLDTVLAWLVEAGIPGVELRVAPGQIAHPAMTTRECDDVRTRIADAGIELTESCAMTPPSAVSGIYINHPQSQYFAVGRIGRDQAEDYAKRRGFPFDEMERWLAPNLGYNPER